jgi:hypothetical protein
LVFDFPCIHPFRESNGRLSRLLTLLALYHHGHKVGRYISLERIIEQSKESYYETLQTSSVGWHDGNHDVMPWFHYFLSTIHAAYRGSMNALGGNGPEIRSQRESVLITFLEVVTLSALSAQAGQIFFVGAGLPSSKFEVANLRFAIICDPQSAIPSAERIPGSNLRAAALSLQGRSRPNGSHA